MERLLFHAHPVSSKAASVRCLAVVVLALAPTAHSADWLTDGGDSRRNNWQKDESILTPANVSGLHLLWKVRLDNQQRQMHSLLEPAGNRQRGNQGWAA